MIFEILFGLGILGMALMTLMGVTHIGGHHNSGHAGTHGLGSAGHHALGGSHGAAHASTGTNAHGPHMARGMRVDSQTDLATQTHGAGIAAHRSGHTSVLAFLPSPIDLVAVCTGAGAAGMLLEKVLSPAILWTVVVLAGIAFDFLLVRPLFGLLVMFASKPSKGLEGVVALSAEAVTGFDAQGRGLVKVALDGQLVQFLARLTAEEIASGIKVQKGDQVVVTEVNAKANTCSVTRELSI